MQGDTGLEVHPRARVLLGREHLEVGVRLGHAVRRSGQASWPGCPPRRARGEGGAQARLGEVWLSTSTSLGGVRVGRVGLGLAVHLDHVAVEPPPAWTR